MWYPNLIYKEINNASDIRKKVFKVIIEDVFSNVMKVSEVNKLDRIVPKEERSYIHSSLSAKVESIKLSGIMNVVCRNTSCG